MRFFIAFCTALTLTGALATGAVGQVLNPVEQLGKSIFFDENLSLNRNQSCASCHGPEVGWTGPEGALNAHGAVYEGSIPLRFGNRKPPSSAYATLSPIFHLSRNGLFVGGNFWDGRATGEKLGNPAADQAQGPFLNPVEQALPDPACAVWIVCESAESDGYPVTFEDVWGAGACDIQWPSGVDLACATEATIVVLEPADREKADTAYDNIALSIAAYEASAESNSFTSRYDYANKGTLKPTKAERKGFALFKGKGKCSKCHLIGGKKPLFTDFTYDNLGVPKNPENPWYDMPPEYNPDGSAWVDLGLGGFLETRDDYRHLAEENMGKHKVPTLRNVDLRPDGEFVKAYGHNGYFKSLKGIVHFYNTRDVKPECPDPFTTEADALAQDCWPAPEVEANINRDELGGLGLTDKEEDAIVAFMKTLSDGFVP